MSATSTVYTSAISLVLKSMVDRARESGAQSAVVTFDPHPSHVLHNSRRTPLITPLAQKLDLLAATGIDLTLVLALQRRAAPLACA